MPNLAEQNADHMTEEPEKSCSISLKIARVLHRTEEHKVTLLQKGFLSLVKNTKQNLQYILQAKCSFLFACDYSRVEINNLLLTEMCSFPHLLLLFYPALPLSGVAAPNVTTLIGFEMSLIQ